MDTSLVDTGGETETTNVSELMQDNEYALSEGFPISMPSKSVELEHKAEPCRSAQQVLDPVSCFW